MIQELTSPITPANELSLKEQFFFRDIETTKWQAQEILSKCVLPRYSNDASNKQQYHFCVLSTTVYLY